VTAFLAMYVDPLRAQLDEALLLLKPKLSMSEFYVLEELPMPQNLFAAGGILGQLLSPMKAKSSAPS
jgi:hypothetical protein